MSALLRNFSLSFARSSRACYSLSVPCRGILVKKVVLVDAPGLPSCTKRLLSVTSFAYEKNSGSVAETESSSSNENGQKDAEKKQVLTTIRKIQIGGILLITLVFVFYLKPKYIDFRRMLENTIKLALVKESSGDVEEAGDLFHDALRNAKEKKFTDGVIYIEDQMANFYMRQKDYKTAETLFKNTLQRMFQEKKCKEDDNSVIEISLKLAQIYENLQREQEAWSGYEFCVSRTTNKLERDPALDQDTNFLALMGLSHNMYAHFLFRSNQLDVAEQQFLAAIRLGHKIEQLTGEKHPQTANILCDLGTLYDCMGRHEEALDRMAEALGACDTPEYQPVILHNMASVHAHKGNKESAEKYFAEAEVQANKYDDLETLEHIKKGRELLNQSENRIAL